MREMDRTERNKNKNTRDMDVRFGRPARCVHVALSVRILMCASRMRFHII